MPKGNGKPIPQVIVNTDMSAQDAKKLIDTLRIRFMENMNRHEGMKWSPILEKLESNKKKLASLFAMEETKGEPDVVGYDEKTKEYIFMDCSEQSPARGNTCYDQAGEDMRIKKGLKPGGNAVSLAKEMGIKMLNEKEYEQLQKLGDFDTTTSSWVETPEDVRKIGGAIFGDKRYGRVFFYHNGAESFYGSRGFRGLLRV